MLLNRIFILEIIILYHSITSTLWLMFIVFIWENIGSYVKVLKTATYVWFVLIVKVSSFNGLQKLAPNYRWFFGLFSAAYRKVLSSLYISYPLAFSNSWQFVGKLFLPSTKPRPRSWQSERQSVRRWVVFWTLCNADLRRK